MEHLPVYIGPGAIDVLRSFCRERELRDLVLVSDGNTQAALGDAVEAALRSDGCDVLKAPLRGDEIGADARSVFQVLLAIDRKERTFLAVGSGTITDVARIVSHRTRSQFVAVPTAPSVDGFTSIGAPLVVNGFKTTIMAHAPVAVFADLPTLCAAPRPMIAAGFGDLIAKLTSSADWELGHLLCDERFDETIAARGRRAAWQAIEAIDAIAARSESGVRAVMEGLIETGFCMLDFGETTPASGSEHHMSHFWEMKLLREGRKAVLHGAKVGIGVIAATRFYDWVRTLSAEDAAALLAARPYPRPEIETQRIRELWGDLADEILSEERHFSRLTPAQFDDLRQRVASRWSEVQRIARTVPASRDVADWLAKVGGPVDGAQIGLSEAEIRDGIAGGHYYRDRLTVAKLAWLLGLPEMLRGA